MILNKLKSIWQFGKGNTDVGKILTVISYPWDSVGIKAWMCNYIHVHDGMYLFIQTITLMAVLLNCR